MISTDFMFTVDVYYPTLKSDLDNSLKVILDCLQSAGMIKNDNKCIRIEANNLKEFISLSEKGIYEGTENTENLLHEISIDKTIELINTTADLLKRKRIVILLDDAALTLTPEYLIEFFDVFRSLKTKRIQE